LDNEAHRFAISYHKKLREKELIPKRVGTILKNY
jgi:excinuclease UvrABC nuclease subunit